MDYLAMLPLIAIVVFILGIVSFCGALAFCIIERKKTNKTKQ